MPPVKRTNPAVPPTPGSSPGKKLGSGARRVLTTALAGTTLAAGLAKGTDALTRLPASDLDQFDAQLPLPCVGTNPVTEAARNARPGEPIQVQVESLWAQVKELSTEVGTEAPSARVAAKACGVVAALHPAIAQRTAALRAAEQAGDKGQVKALQTELRELRSVHGGARIILRSGESLSGAWEEYEARLWRDNGAVLKALTGGPVSLEAAVAQLARGHEALEEAAEGSSGLATSVQTDAADLQARTSSWNRQGWVDKLTAGASVEGALYRTGRAQQQVASSESGAFSELVETSRTKLHDGLDRLLRGEDPQYAAARSRYEWIQPAHDAVQSVEGLRALTVQSLQQAERAKDALRRVERRAPNPLVSVEGGVVANPEYARWESDLSSAQRDHRSAVGTARSHFEQLGGEFDEMMKHLELSVLRADFKAASPGVTRLGQAQKELDRVSRGGDLSGIRRSLERLGPALVTTQQELAPGYQALHDAVWSAIQTRHAELLAQR
jgi:hypothetical protein